MREDLRTTTPEDAGWFERHRHPGYGPDRPSASDLAEDAALDRAIEQDRERRRDRGEYVPDVWTNLAAMIVMHRLPGVAADPARDRVLRLTGPVSVEAATVALSPDFEVREHDGTVWARVTDAYHTYLTTPPF